MHWKFSRRMINIGTQLENVSKNVNMDKLRQLNQTLKKERRISKEKNRRFEYIK